jgi:outer membrane immunogenic protein
MINNMRGVTMSKWGNTSRPDRRFLLVAVAAVAAIIMTPALAADLSSQRPVPKAPVAIAPVANWTGCYVKAGGGYGMWNQESIFDSGPNSSSGLSPATTSGGRGWFGTVGGGCDVQFGGRWVIGAFADYDLADIKGDYINVNLGWAGSEKLRSSSAVGGRLGWLVRPEILTYVSGGYTQARFSRVDLFFVPFNPPFDEGAHLPATTYSGWFLGGGTEFMVIPGWFVRSEYRYARYDDKLVPMLVSATGAPLFGRGTFNEKFVQTIRTELVWKWNWGG